MSVNTFPFLRKNHPYTNEVRLMGVEKRSETGTNLLHSKAELERKWELAWGAYMDYSMFMNSVLYWTRSLFISDWLVMLPLVWPSVTGVTQSLSDSCIHEDFHLCRMANSSLMRIINHFPWHVSYKYTSSIYMGFSFSFLIEWKNKQKVIFDKWEFCLCKICLCFYIQHKMWVKDLCSIPWAGKWGGPLWAPKQGPWPQNAPLEPESGIAAPCLTRMG